MTEIEAINVGLQSIGEQVLSEAPFAETTVYAVGDRVAYGPKEYEFHTAHPKGFWDASHVNEVTSYEALQAATILDEVRKEVLARGFYTNTEDAWPIEADPQGYIDIPPTALRVDGIDNNHIAKNGRLYDKSANSFLFTPNQPVDVKIIWDAYFVDLEYDISYYITLRMARILYQRVIGVSEILGVLGRDEENARIRLMESEADIGDYSIFDAPSTTRAITRNKNPRGILG